MKAPPSFVPSTMLALVLLAQPMASQIAVPVGGEFQVNTYTTNMQRYPAVGLDDEGNFLVVWQSEGSGGSDNSEESIQGRIFISNGSPIGGEGQVNSYVPGGQKSPSVAVNASGDFVIVWHSFGSGGDDDQDTSIQGQRYASNGSTVGSEFQVNTYTTGFQVFPAVGLDDDGDFAVVWASGGSTGGDSSGWSIQGRVYASNGSPIGPQGQVNTYTSGFQRFPRIGVDTDGDFVVVWTSDGSGGDDSQGYSIQGQRYGSNGLPDGGEFQVNTYTMGDQKFPALGLDTDGDFVVVWQGDQSGGDDNWGESIHGRLYASNGAPLGLDAQVNTYTTGVQRNPAVAIDAEGSFVVVWMSEGSNGSDISGRSIQSRLYEPDGLPVGIERQVNSYTTNDQQVPRVGIGVDGNFVVVWESDGSGGSDSEFWSIQSQRFAISLFADGFESGDTSQW